MGKRLIRILGKWFRGRCQAIPVQFQSGLIRRLSFASARKGQPTGTLRFTGQGDSAQPNMPPEFGDLRLRYNHPVLIRRVADSVVVSCCCEQLEGELFQAIRIIYGSKSLTTSPRPIPLDSDDLQHLAQSWSDALIAYDELVRTNHLAELGPYIPGEAAVTQRINRTRDLDRQKSVAMAEGRRSVNRAKAALERYLESLPLKTPLILKADARYYALHSGSLWSSTRCLTNEQWLGLISQAIQREEAKLQSVVAIDGASVNGRGAIPSDVRIEVWRRDGGRCGRCGSRERLEFDHIVPIALGGSNTARNIELLCEVCNRSKSDSIG